MSDTQIQFVLTDAQAAAMKLLAMEDVNATIHNAVQSKLIAALTYQRKKIEDEAQDNFARIDSFLKANNIPNPQTFGQFKAKLMSEVQNALDELGYVPNKKKDDAEVK